MPATRLYVSRLFSTFKGAFPKLLRASVSIKRQQNEDACVQKHSQRVHFPQGFSILPYGSFNENPSKRALF